MKHGLVTKKYCIFHIWLDTFIQIKSFYKHLLIFIYLLFLLYFLFSYQYCLLGVFFLLKLFLDFRDYQFLVFIFIFSILELPV